MSPKLRKLLNDPLTQKKMIYLFLTETICIISDSITQRINMNEFNYYVKNANVYKRYSQEQQ